MWISELLGIGLNEFCCICGIVSKWYHFADLSSAMVVPAGRVASGYVLV
jgi:hypothetical protein